jgi:ferulate-5-hydroxylase
VEKTDIEKLTYLKCVVKETLRLHPPITLLHETIEDTAIGGYFVPKGSRVMINVWVIGRDKDSWEDPEEFRPSRFLDSSVPDFKESHLSLFHSGQVEGLAPGCNFIFMLWI